MELLENDQDNAETSARSFKLGLIGALGFLVPVAIGIVAAVLNY